MALEKNHSVSIFLIKTAWILFIIFYQFNLVICDDLEEDNLRKALESIERRQKDYELQENEYYGQPENIGYGFQKTLGFFDGGNGDPIVEIGNYNFEPKTENEFRNALLDYQRERESEKKKSNFRERMSPNYRMNYLMDDKEDNEDYGRDSDYSQMARNIWSKHPVGQTGRNDYFGAEDNAFDLERAEDILNSPSDRETGEERFGNYYGSEPNGFRRYEAIPARSRRNYRVFDGFGDRRKRYPSFGEGFYGKRNYRSRQVDHENLPYDDFLYSLKYVGPEVDEESVENSREEGFDMLDGDRERDVIRILNNAANRPRYMDEGEPSRSKDGNNYDDEIWLQEPFSFTEDRNEDFGKDDKRAEVAPRYFKPHNGIHVNSKRFPVKRSETIRVRKDVKNEKVSKELKGIFENSQSTTVPPKKGTPKKQAEIAKKQNVTKPAVTKHRDGKKVIRSAGKYAKEDVLPVRQNEEISALFNVDKKSPDKKSIDWSQYFGIDKRSSNWLNDDYLSRTESHFLAPKSEGPGKADYSDRQRYQIPFDTRIFDKKNHPNDIGTNIDKVENKIEDIEEKIIEDALKYTGAHSGGYRGEDLNEVKSRVVQHLEAAYSLEKMKNALEEFKNLIKPGRTSVKTDLPKKSVTEAPKAEPRTIPSASKENSNLEKPLLDNKQKGESKRKKGEGVERIFEGDSNDKLKFLNEPSFSSRRPYESKECPVLDQVLENCMRIEGMTGKYAELLVPLCSLQQICYFCGGEIGISKMSACDSIYLTEAQNVCQDNGECLANARDGLMALKDMYEQDFMNKKSRLLFSGTCLSNPCVQRYFLNGLGAIYSLEVQN